MLELYLGGTRSGKSKLAEAAASLSALEVVYFATAKAGDGEMQKRISAHQSSRPSHWLLVEEPFELASRLIDHAREGRCLLVDCLTLWLTNCLFEKDKAFFDTQKQQLLEVLDDLPGTIIMVSNETNMGVIPMGELSREFCDQAGLLHQQIAEKSHKVTLAVAGLPHVLKNELE